MNSSQVEQLEATLLDTVDRLSKTATTAAEVDALAAVVQALVNVSRLGLRDNSPISSSVSNFFSGFPARICDSVIGFPIQFRQFFRSAVRQVL